MSGLRRRMGSLATALLAFVGLVNLLPLSGVLSAARLDQLYGLSLTDPNLVILMRHRAVLLGITGALLIWAAFQPRLRTAAVLFGFLSMSSFVLLAGLVGDFNSDLRRIVIADIVGCVLLLVAIALLRWLNPSSE